MSLLRTQWAFLLIDHLGRTKLLMIGSAGCSVSMFIVGCVFPPRPSRRGASSPFLGARSGYIAIGKPQNKTTANLDSGGVAAIFFLYLWTSASPFAASKLTFSSWPSSSGSLSDVLLSPSCSVLRINVEWHALGGQC